MFYFKHVNPPAICQKVINFTKKKESIHVTSKLHNFLLTWTWATSKNERSHENEKRRKFLKVP